MTDKQMIDALRHYVQAYTSDRPYALNPGLALMIANRLEQLTTMKENDKEIE